ncbi:TerC family protein [Pusillimonas noertemannii]|uniref:Putative tellurium resistance membrane protein TerC n=1 Tax=Pusillimonas noertemannii TaxID=305977 RepID=A0A2U1CMY7_9BURK|nr:TerC family protein [Pusillimonas noertemannii]NYT68600.1 TerC family protein [Pusillimonas noertemannii]PVY62383.1 putative tellurium resistance membrane protein TerC [Pusillimonas noertemannii]TFL10652.1 TerC family protein [Pusillimonas noertemannii]
MDLLFDPNVWIGLLTLVVLEIVLGIDNLIFIAILAEKLPPQQRDRARVIGLSLALLMRLGLLSIVSWLVTLTAPLFSIAGMAFSGRDLILLLGGLFLLFKATSELHERLEGKTHAHSQSKAYAGFGVVVAQIVVLDAVFSLDAVITAVGMVDELPVMMAAVVISIGIMLWASKPLTRFVSAHPTVVVLCLSFLLMIGLSLTAEGLGFHIPKGYLYAAIGFSIVIEFFNQLARRSILRNEARLPLRDRTAEAVLRILGAKRQADEVAGDMAPADESSEPPAFGAEERNMVSGVLTLGERTVRTIMTPRSDISWVDVDDDPAKTIKMLRDTPHSFFPAGRGDLDTLLGVVRAKDLLAGVLDTGRLDVAASLRQPIVINELTGVIKAMETLRNSHGQLALVADEYGTIQGLVTPIDILEAIAGEFPDEDEQPSIQALDEGYWRVSGATDLHHLEQELGTGSLFDDDIDVSSIAGLVLARLDSLPEPGSRVEIDGFEFEVAELQGRRITQLRVRKLPDDDMAA